MKNHWSSYMKQASLLEKNILSLIFAKKCTRNPKTKHLFPINKQRSVLKLRKQEKFKIITYIRKDLKNQLFPKWKYCSTNITLKKKEFMTALWLLPMCLVFAVNFWQWNYFYMSTSLSNKSLYLSKTSVFNTLQCASR